MRPLKRPMFKYGGDVKKQGIMHGMNGLRDGGPATMADATMMAGGGMANNQGPKRAALVGNPVYPVGPDGRTKHVAPIVIGAGMGLARLAPLAMRYAARPFGNFVRRQFMGPNTATVGGRKLLGKNVAGFSKEMFQPNKFGKYLLGSPEAKFVTGAGGTISKYVPKIAKGIAKSPTGLAITAASLTDIFPGGKPFGPDKYLPNLFGQRFDADGNKVDGPLFGKVKPKVLTTTEDGTRKSLLKTDSAPKELTTAEKETKDKERLNKIYKLLGVDRAQRNAASKALVDVSRYIDEGGKDTISKKNIGSTISKAISSFDKRLDKSDQLKEAAGVMMAKSYLDGGDKALDRRLKEATINRYEKEANPSISNLKAIYKKSGIDDPSGTAAKEKFGDGYGGALMSTKDFNKQLKAFEGQQLEEDTILEIATNAVKNLEMASEEGKKVPNGYYKVGENIVLITDGEAQSIVG
jgi:hypothetical protein